VNKAKSCLFKGCGEMGHETENPFDLLAARYDRWFDSPEGMSIFTMEKECLHKIMKKAGKGWLEVGVGTGRFSAALGVAEGIDPSKAMLTFAAQRGINTRCGYAEDLPYPDAFFDGVLMVTTLCFIQDPGSALKECARVIKGNGSFIIEMVPSGGPRGRLYVRKGNEGHPFYSQAKFYTCRQVVRMTATAGFIFADGMSCLLTPPQLPMKPFLECGVHEKAGFVALRFMKVK
jgi:ubiquinone/menaquinone biosynthesis C-methylase UbiE